MRKSGFTFSEVLITLAIIGIVAAILIPPISSNIQAEHHKTAYKKSISVINNAISRHYALEGLTVQDYTSSKDLVNDLFKKRLNTINGPTKFTDYECDESDDKALFTTTDGMMFCIANFAADTSNEKDSKCDIYNQKPCTLLEGANLWVDVNGEQKPNRVTRQAKKPYDIYEAQLFAQKVAPYGEAATIIFNGGTDNYKYNNKDEDKDIDNGENFDEDTNNNHPNLGDDINPNTPPSDNNDNPNNNDDGSTPSFPDEDDDYTPDDDDNNQEDDNKPESEENEENDDSSQDENNPLTPNEDDFGEENVPDKDSEYYDDWDPNKWPSWWDFLKWILGKIIELVS